MVPSKKVGCPVHFTVKRDLAGGYATLVYHAWVHAPACRVQEPRMLSAAVRAEVEALLRANPKLMAHELVHAITQRIATDYATAHEMTVEAAIAAFNAVRCVSVPEAASF